MEWEPFIRMFAAAGFAGLIGLDRELRAKPAGLRTNIVVGVAAGAFAYAGLNAFPAGDPSRVAAQIVSGIGFLGGGAIFAAGGQPSGLTTAAALWGSAAAGLAAGVGAYATGLALVAVTVLALWPLDRAASSLLAGCRRTNTRIAVVVRDLGAASRARALLGEVGIRVDRLEMRPFGDQGVAMELVVHATRLHLGEAICRLRLLDDVLFVSEEAVPGDGRARLRSRRQVSDRTQQQAFFGLPSQTGPSRLRGRRRRGAGSEMAGRRGGQQPDGLTSTPATSNEDGCSERATVPSLVEPSGEPDETRLFALSRPVSSSMWTSGTAGSSPAGTTLACWHSSAPPSRSSLLRVTTEIPDSDLPSRDQETISRDLGLSSNDPFSHLSEAGMKRLSEAHERALLQALAVDLREPPAGLLLNEEEPLQPHIVLLGGFRVYDVVPQRFQAYARVFHPFEGRTTADGTRVRARWSGIVDCSSETMDGDVRLESIRAAAARRGFKPLIGMLDRSTAVSLADVLKRHTKTPGAINLLFWGGLDEFGKEQDVIYQAPIDVVGSLYPYGLQRHLPPTLWWDAAGDWFVATHPNSASTYLGGCSQLVSELSHSKKIEAVEVKPQTFVDVVISGRPE